MLHHKANQSYYLAMFFLPSMVDQRKVKFFSSIIFPSFFFFYKKKKKKRWSSKSVTADYKHKFQSISVDDIRKHKFKENYNKIINLLKFIVICHIS